MNDDDDFELRKTGRIRLPIEDPPATDASETTQRRERPLERPSPKPGEDPAFDRKKTSVFRRAVLLPPQENGVQTEEGAQDDEDEEEAEPITGEYRQVKPRRSSPKGEPKE